MNILIATSEYSYLAKSGGLADAVVAIAEGLARRDHRVDVVLPKYKKINTDSFTRHDEPLGVQVGDGTYWCAVHTKILNGVHLHLVEYDELFRRDGIYGPTPSEAYGDNLRRFTVLSVATLEIAGFLDIRPDIIHVHDWPTAPVALYLRTRYADTPALSESRNVLSIHNLGFQGVFPRHDALRVLGFDDETAENLGITGPDGINLLRGGILNSDRVVTVSPTHATEIIQPRYGFGLHTALQIRGPHLTGILNGIDTSVWNPDTDQYLPARYNVDDLRGKRVCKQRLQEELELPVDQSVPLIGTITRLTQQKGIDELFGENYGVARRLLEELPIQWVVLGTGDGWCEDQIHLLAREFPNFAGLTMYSDTLAHQIEGGSDLFLMPSRYEPCGLNQMYSMRYGTIPIVTRTGGLVDTVDSTTGFHIEAHTPDAIFYAVAYAVDTYTHRPDEFREMQRAGMNRDFGIDAAILRYEELYQDALSGPS
ncbi:MAG: glycogen synthase [Alkalispirochaeta sp.]